MGERPGRNSRQRNRRVCAGKADTVSYVRVRGGLYFKSFASAPGSWRFNSPALDGTEARDLDLWRRQTVQGRSGTGIVEASLDSIGRRLPGKSVATEQSVERNGEPILPR